MIPHPNEEQDMHVPYFDPTESTVEEFLDNITTHTGCHPSPFSSILRKCILLPGMLQVHRQVMMSAIAKQFVPISGQEPPYLVPEYTEDIPDIPGLYLRTAFMLWKGWNLEDAAVISRSAAGRMTTDVVQTESLTTTAEPEPVVGIGEEVHRGSILGTWKMEPGEIDCGYPRRGELNLLTNSRPIPGTVTDIRKYTEYRNSNIVWNLEVDISMEYRLGVGAKVSNLHASKSIISRVVPDRNMPHDLYDRPVDLLISPYAIARRMSPSTVMELMLNTYVLELRRRLRKPIRLVVAPFDGELTFEAVARSLKAMGLHPDCNIQLKDGKLGRCFQHRTLVGPLRWGRLLHHPQDKIRTTNDVMINHRGAAVRGTGAQRLGREEIEVIMEYGSTDGLIQEIAELQGRTGTRERIMDLLSCLGYEENQ